MQKEIRKKLSGQKNERINGKKMGTGHAGLEAVKRRVLSDRR